MAKESKLEGCDIGKLVEVQFIREVFVSSVYNVPCMYAGMYVHTVLYRESV